MGERRIHTHRGKMIVARFLAQFFNFLRRRVRFQQGVVNISRNIARHVGGGQTPRVRTQRFVLFGIVNAIRAIDQREIAVILKVIRVEIGERMRIEAHVGIMGKK